MCVLGNVAGSRLSREKSGWCDSPQTAVAGIYQIAADCSRLVELSWIGYVTLAYKSRW